MGLIRYRIRHSPRSNSGIVDPFFARRGKAKLVHAYAQNARCIWCPVLDRVISKSNCRTFNEHFYHPLIERILLEIICNLSKERRLRQICGFVDDFASQLAILQCHFRRQKIS